MNKYLTSFLLLGLPMGAAANIGSGLYISAGVGGGWLDASEITSFDLDYPIIFAVEPDSNAVNEDVLNNFENSVEYGTTSDTMIAGRAAIGYLWDVFEGEPTKFANAIYTVNATFGFEFGFRIFDTASVSNTIIEEDDINVPPTVPPPPQESPYDVFETATVETRNKAFDFLAVARLPFTEDNRFALLLKGGVAYNMYSFENTNLTIEADLDVPQDGYNRQLDLRGTQDHDEFLPVLGAGLEYMFYSHLGISAEYNAIMGSSHNADSQLITGNIILRM